MTSKIPASKPSGKTAKRPAKAATPEIAAEPVIPTLAADTADVKIAAEEAACIADATQAAAVDGLTALSREYATFFEKSAEEASDLMKALWTAKSLPEAIEIGNKYGLDALAAYLAHLKRLQEIAAQSSGKAFEPFADVLESPLAWWKTAA
ncbi:MAG: phasin family protein [Sphingomonadales bacterium]|nr:phasin family protein [Sphingomonadales bacterium]